MEATSLEVSPSFIRQQPAAFNGELFYYANQDILDHPSQYAPIIPSVGEETIGNMQSQLFLGKASIYNDELQVLHAQFSSEMPSTERYRTVASKLIEYVAFGHESYEYDRPSTMARRFQLARQTLQTYMSHTDIPNVEEVNNYLKDSLLTYYKNIEEQLLTDDPFVWIQGTGSNMLGGIEEGKAYHKVFLDKQTAERTLRWNHYVQNQLQKGNMDRLFDTSEGSPQRAACKLADGHLLDMGNFLMAEIGQIRGRIIHMEDSSAELSTRWKFEGGYSPWITQVITTHIKDGALAKLSHDVGTATDTHLNGRSYQQSYANLLQLMQNSHNNDRYYFDFSSVYSYETWIYDPQLIVLFPHQGVSELAALAGDIVVESDASAEQIKMATKNRERREAFEQGKYKPKKVARKITKAEIEEIIQLDQQQLQQRIAAFRENQLAA